MNDYSWFIIIGILFVLLSIIFIVLGYLIWKKQKIDLIISYHCEKVSEENKQMYCRFFGIGMLDMGIGFGLSGICTVLFQSVLAFIPMTIGLVVGIAMIILAVVKYNR